jgi:branched-chain amino acid transport system permease protein
LLAGFTGQLSFAHIAFSAIGAYTTGLLTLYTKIPVVVGVLTATLFAGVVGLGVGLLCLRLRKGYLLLVTFAFAEIVRRILFVEYKITGGDHGLKIPYLFGEFGSPLNYYTLLSMAVICVSFIFLILRSHIGLYLKSIREDEEAAAVMGLNVVRWKLTAFVVSSLIAGLSGAIYAHYIGVIHPDMLGLLEMGNITAMVVIGGIGTIVGPILGALFMELTSEIIRPILTYRFILFGTLMIIMMKYARGGLWATIRKRLKLAEKLRS